MAWFLADKYLFKVNNRNTGKRCETCLKVDRKNTKKKQKKNRATSMYSKRLWKTVFKKFEGVWSA